jgi:Tfp pilus assembly protein PilO
VKRTDLTILAAVGVLGLVAAFWFLVLSPKREEAAELGDKVTQLEASVAEQEQLAAAAEEAESGYNENYQRVVVLGKAVPQDADTPSLLVELQDIADRENVDFQSITLADGSGVTDAAQVATPPPLTAPETGSTSEETTPASTDPSAEGESTETSTETTSAESTTAESSTTGSETTATDASTTTTATTAPATEATAATLPIGATVGPAGLPVMPYDLSFSGGFFEVADFLADLDELVDAGSTEAHVHGRLLTVDGFSLAPVEDTAGGSPTDPVLNVSLAVTTYVTPAEQGLVAGATPGAPAPTTPAPATTTPATEATTASTATTTTTTTP